MVRGDSALLKTQRLKIIAQQLAQRLTKNKTVDYEGFLTVIEYEHGLTRKKAKHYVHLICETHSWEIELLGEKAFIKVIAK